MNQKSFVSLARKVMYGIALLGIILFLGIGASGVPTARAQGAGTETPTETQNPEATAIFASDYENEIYINQTQNYQFEYPAGWYVYPDFYEGRYPDLKTTLVSSFEIKRIGNGELIIPKGEAAVIIGFAD